jgi:GMP synthase PP-ATPase subunit
LPEVFDRRPFPAPGLAIRCLGGINREKLDIPRLSDEVLIPAGVRPRRGPHHQRGQGVNRVVYDVTSKPPGTIERRE